MLKLLLALPDGAEWVEKKINSAGWVRLHPSLVDYMDELNNAFSKNWFFYEAIGMIPIPKGEP